MPKEPCHHVCQAIAPYSIPSGAYRPDMKNVDFDVRIHVFATIVKRFFDGIERSFDPKSGPIKYGIKYRAGCYIYADETGIVQCDKYADCQFGIEEVHKVTFCGEKDITTRIFEEFKKFALEQNLEEVILEILKPPRLVNRNELARENIKKFAGERGIKYAEKIELR